MEYLPSVVEARARILAEDSPGDDMPDASGIYLLTNRINGYVYVGQSVRMRTRVRQHVAALDAGKHQNELLQQHWNEYGARAFVFHVLVECGNEQLDEVEESLIAQVFGGECYNLAEAARGGARPGAGRKRHIDRKSPRQIRLTRDQRLKLAALGGPAFIRQVLDSTPWPSAKRVK